jgi:hypothetical protein
MRKSPSGVVCGIWLTLSNRNLPFPDPAFRIAVDDQISGMETRTEHAIPSEVRFESEKDDFEVAADFDQEPNGVKDRHQQRLRQCGATKD